GPPLTGAPCVYGSQHFGIRNRLALGGRPLGQRRRRLDEEVNDQRCERERHDDGDRDTSHGGCLLAECFFCSEYGDGPPWKYTPSVPGAISSATRVRSVMTWLPW